MPDAIDTDACDCEYGGPCYEHDESYRLYCDEQTAIHDGLATELTHCYLCEPDVNKRTARDAGPLRGIARTETMRTHPTHPEADSYAVTICVPCGHALI